MLWAFGSIFILICVVISILEQEYQPVDRLASVMVSRSQMDAAGTHTEGRAMNRHRVQRSPESWYI
jgi:hypothetical protein